VSAARLKRVVSSADLLVDKSVKKECGVGKSGDSGMSRRGWVPLVSFISEKMGINRNVYPKNKLDVVGGGEGV